MGPPPPRALRAFRAMKDLGISEEIVKPVLKRLLRLYEKKWELIEAENYRGLADAIFEYEEAKAAEDKNKPKNSDEEDLEEALINDESERPLKRLRLRNQDGQGSSSLYNSSPSSGTSLAQENSKPSHVASIMCAHPGSTTTTCELQSVYSRNHLKRRGKDPIPSAPQSHPLPKNNVPNNLVLMKPKDEPVSDDLLQFEVPLAVIHPEPESEDALFVTATCRRGDISECNIGYDKEECIHKQGSSTKKGTSGAIAVIREGLPTSLDIASSSSGEVKISISCNSRLGIPGFQIPDVDAFLKAVEDRCLGLYKTIDTNLSLKKFLREMCECFLELGTESADEPQENPVLEVSSPLVESLEQSPTWDTLNPRSRVPSCSFIETISVPAEAMPGFVELLPYSNSADNERRVDKEIIHNGFDKGTEYESSCSAIVSQECLLTPHDVRMLHDVHDISKGEEKVKIPWKNEINSEHPTPFHYIPQNIAFKSAHVNFSLDHIGNNGCCSKCFGNCLLSSVPCACTHEFEGGFPYTLNGLLKEAFLEESRLATRMIRECWRKCGCNKQCGNRLVQRGITCNLQVFLTANGKGWGLRTLDDIPKGAFVCEYVGEILTHLEFRERRRINSTEQHAYTVLLDADWGVSKDKVGLCLDARYYGNIARFINHSCSDANLVEVRVQVETSESHYYHLAFFTSRKVNALEELTWDYGVDFVDQKNHSMKVFHCVCGSACCRDTKRITNCKYYTFLFLDMDSELKSTIMDCLGKTRIAWIGV